MSIDPGAAAGIALAVLVVFAYLISRFIYIVHQAEGKALLYLRCNYRSIRKDRLYQQTCIISTTMNQYIGIVLEKFGVFNRILTPGIHFVVPFIEVPRKFSWKKTVIKDGTLRDEECITSKIDMRESVFNFQPMRVFTNDTVELEVHPIMYFTIVDVKKAVYEVDDLATSIIAFAQTQLKDTFGTMAFQHAIQAQDEINSNMRLNIGQRVKNIFVRHSVILKSD
jgi:regulator of protease activity HflC (stomatin/prohibitin superfamily)